jgi:aldose 1-epimerase
MAGDATIKICDGISEAVILPSIGAALSSYGLIESGRQEPLFRSTPPLFRSSPASAPSPFDLACNLLVPWSNRISRGGFTFRGRFYPLEPNLPGEPSPIHGNGFSSPWQVIEHGPASAKLQLSSEGPGPFRYEAVVIYALSGGALTVDLAVTNLMTEPLPYGLGLHPWLPRTPATTLRAPAHEVWLEGERHLPTNRVSVVSRPEWDFAKHHALPPDWINNGFTGWSGSATIVWPERGLALDIDASPPISTYLLYSPGATADFFCFEPVSHSVDAHNLPGGPENAGLVVLAPGDTLSIRARFSPRRVAENTRRIHPPSILTPA